MLQESVQWKTSKGKAVKVCLDEGLFHLQCIAKFRQT